MKTIRPVLSPITAYFPCYPDELLAAWATIHPDGTAYLTDEQQ